jgi:proteasome accessory factor B
MQKAERLLDLAAFLLRAKEPVSWREIQEQFADDYGGGSEEAAVRKFERDKAELLELGIPVKWLAGDEDLAAGYVLDRDAFYLPDLKLAPEDLALLYVAGSAALAQGAFPYSRDLAHAMNKLSFAARAPGATEGAAQVTRTLSSGEDAHAAERLQKLEQVGAAIAAKKRVRLSYRGAQSGERTERDVDPYGVYQRGGAWFLAGHCHLRNAVRVFHLDRIETVTPNRKEPRSADFAAPAGFSLADLAGRESWEYRLHPPKACAVRLEGPAADARETFGPRAKLVAEAGGVRVELEATNLDGLVRHVLSLGDRAELVSPPEARARARDALSDLAARLA